MDRCLGDWMIGVCTWDAGRCVPSLSILYSELKNFLTDWLIKLSMQDQAWCVVGGTRTMGWKGTTGTTWKWVKKLVKDCYTLQCFLLLRLDTYCGWYGYWIAWAETHHSSACARFMYRERTRLKITLLQLEWSVGSLNMKHVKHVANIIQNVY